MSLNDRRCRYCGQPLPEIRLGVRLTPLKARIFDLIQRAGQDGIFSDDLRAVLEMNGNTLKAHVQQINTAILGSGYCIYGRGRYFRLVRRSKQ